MHLKRQLLYLMSGVLCCALGINELIHASEHLFFPLMDYVEQEVEVSAQVEDKLTCEMILMAQEQDEESEEPEQVEETPTLEVASFNMEKLSNYEYLRSSFYTVDSTTMIGEDQLNIEDLMMWAKGTYFSYSFSGGFCGFEKRRYVYLYCGNGSVPK